MGDYNSTLQGANEADNRPKQRHGCLTAWLIFVIVVNMIVALAYPGMGSIIHRTMPGFPEWFVWPFAACSVLNIIFAIALFAWKRWGFYGMVLDAVIAFGLNLYVGASPIALIVGLAGVGLLFGVLQIGGNNSGWSQLE
jgi:hypothetical protein